MQPADHSSEGQRARSAAAALPLLQAAAATTTAPPLTLLTTGAAYRGHKGVAAVLPRAETAKSTGEAARSSASPMRPSPDWSRPLAALERQRESARLAYTPYTVAAADVVASRQAELVARRTSHMADVQEVCGDDDDGTATERSEGQTKPPLQLLPPLPADVALLPRGESAGEVRRRSSSGGGGLTCRLKHTPAQVSQLLTPFTTAAATADNAYSLQSSSCFNWTAPPPPPDAPSRRYAASVPPQSPSATGRPQLASRRLCGAATPPSSALRASRAHTPTTTASRGDLPAGHPLSPELSAQLTTDGNGDVIAQHYSQLTHLLQGYSVNEEVFAVAEAGGQRRSWLSDGTARPPLTSLESETRNRAGHVLDRGCAEMAPPTPREAQQLMLSTPTPSSPASGDLFRQAAAQHRPFSLRAVQPTKAELARFQRHLERYFERQLRGLCNCEETERAQLQGDAFRALRTLLGLHERFCDYVELRTRQRKALAVLQEEEAELQSVYAHVVPCEMLLPAKTDEQPRRTSIDDSTAGRTADTDDEEREESIFTELVENVSTLVKARAQSGVFEELTTGRISDLRVMMAELQEVYEALVSPLDFDLMEIDATTCTRVPPSVDPFEALTVEEGENAALVERVAALQELFEELVVTEKTPTAVTPAADAEEARDVHAKEEEKKEEEVPFEELIAPPGTPEAETCADAVDGAPPVPFEVLLVPTEAHERAVVDALPPRFEELNLSSAHNARNKERDEDKSLSATDAAAVAEVVSAMQEAFESLTLMRGFDELTCHDDEEEGEGRAALNMPPPLTTVEELVADAATDEALARLQEVYEELVLPLEPLTAEEEEAPVGPFANGASHSTELFQVLEERQGMEGEVPPRASPFEELQVSPETKAEVAALHEVFEELLLVRPFEELAVDVGTTSVSPPPLEPFEQLAEGAAEGDRYNEVDAALRREVFEELGVPPPEEAASSVSSTAATADDLAAAQDVFLELVMRTGTHTKLSDAAEPFEELQHDPGTEEDVAERLEAFEELVLSLSPPTPSSGAEVGSDYEGQYSDLHEEEVDCSSQISSTGYRVGAPKIFVDEHGTAVQVICAFTDLTLDAFASTALGDVFAEACGVRRPVTFSCCQHVEGGEWCAVLRTAGAAVRACVVADVCATLECPAVCVRNVTLTATAGRSVDGASDSTAVMLERDAMERAAAAAPSHDDEASNRTVDVQAADVGLAVSFDLVQETVFALNPQDVVQYLVSECTFPFLQQWCRSRAALLLMDEGRARSPTPTLRSSAATPTASTAVVHPVGGAVLPLWAYSTESARPFRKSAVKLPSARLSFSRGFQTNKSSLLVNGVVAQQQGNTDMAKGAAATPRVISVASQAVPHPREEPVVDVLPGVRTGLAAPVPPEESVLSGADDESPGVAPQPPSKRKGFFSRKPRGE